MDNDNFVDSLSGLVAGILSLKFIHIAVPGASYKGLLSFAFTPLIANGLIIYVALPNNLTVVGSVATASGLGLFWLLDYCVLFYCLIAFPKFSCNKALQLAPQIAALLSTDTNRADLISYFSRWHTIRRQYIFSATAAIAGVTMALLSHEPLLGIVEVTAIHVAIVGVVSFFGANCVYWLCAGPFTVWRLAKMPNLDLRWYSPASTPIIRDASRIFGLSTLLAVIGVCLVFLPAIIFYTMVGNEAMIVFVNTVLFLIGFLTILIVGAVPQVALARLISRAKTRAMNDLAKRIEHSTVASEEDGESLIGLYEKIRSTPSTALGLHSSLEYIATIAAGVVPVLIQVI